MAQRPELATTPATRPAPRRPSGIRGRGLWTRYSRFVGLMKVILPAIAAALLGIIIFWPHLMSHDQHMTLGFAKNDATKVDTLSIRNPRYYGTDDKNRPFTLTADIATQVDPQALVVTLEKPVADLIGPDGGGIVIDAEIGFYRQKDDTLDLMQHVDFFQDNGYELHTESARILIAQGDASGDQAVTGQGPAGTLIGEGFRMTERGRRIVFTGHSKAVLSVGARKEGS